MPMFDFFCEVCGMPRRVWRPADSPPRFCCKACMTIGMSGYKFKEKWPVSEEAHEEIRRVYQQRPRSNQIRDLARRLRLPRWKVTRYAISQGWVAKQKKEPPWTEKEMNALRSLARYAPETVARKMRARGYKRTVTACVLKMRRMRMSQNLNGQSARSLAECLGEDTHFVVKAIKRGDLTAARRGTARTEKQGGDMYYIKDQYVRKFIVENVAVIDLRKVDKYWFVDLLAG